MNALQTQLRVIFALTLREINSQQQSLMYGYAWALVDIVLSIGGLLIMKLAIRAFTPVGMPPATFIISGIIPWFLFQQAYNTPAKAIAKNRRLLIFPLVTGLDLVFAAELELLIAYGIIYVVGSVISSSIESSPPPISPLAIMLLFFASWFYGVFLGLVLLPLRRIYPPVEKFISFFLRFGLILSSVVFPITFFPEYVWPYLSWNPMLHVEELLRFYWFPAYHTPIGSTLYVLECLLGLGVLGLLCERYARWRLPEA